MILIILKTMALAWLLFMSLSAFLAYMEINNRDIDGEECRADKSAKIMLGLILALTSASALILTLD